MGAVTSVRMLAYAKWQGEIAPRIRARVQRTGGYRDAIGAEMFGECDELRSDLGVRDDDQLLVATYPRMDGACLSTTCPGRTACPVHPANPSAPSAEDFMCDLQKAFVSECCGGPTWLGRNANWFHFRGWYAMELGREASAWSDADLMKALAADPLLSLLLRLGKRGAAVGWADGGSGEGLLGWLAPDETRTFASALAAYALDASAAVPAALVDVDPYAAEHELPSMRTVMAKLLATARTAADAVKGIALIRE